MRRPASSTPAYRDESIGAKWSEIKDYEKELGSGGDAVQTVHTVHVSETGSPRLSMATTKQRFIQFRKQSSQRLSNIKHQIAGKYRRTGGDEDTRSEVSTAPSGDIDTEIRGPSVNCTSVKSLGAVGRGIKSSKSLQNLEQITKDSWRSVADKTSYMGQNLKHKYSSKVDINKLAPKMNYEELNGDESDDENRFAADRLF